VPENIDLIRIALNDMVGEVPPVAVSIADQFQSDFKSRADQLGVDIFNPDVMAGIYCGAATVAYWTSSGKEPVSVLGTVGIMLHSMLKASEEDPLSESILLDPPYDQDAEDD
jgi:hypothetical protein